jgi:hypothetical protein
MPELTETAVVAEITIHAVLYPTLRRDPQRMTEIKDVIVGRYNIRNFNESRYARFGIISGNIDASLLDRLRREHDLKSVSVDEVRHTL